MKREFKQEKKKTVTIDTNPQQIISIIVLFLVMFVFPIQLHSLYKNGELTRFFKKSQVLGTSTDIRFPAQNSILGVDTSKLVSKELGDILVYGGIAFAIIAFILFLYLLLKPKNSVKDE